MKTVLKAAGLYFLAVFAAGFVFGTARVLWLLPQVGSRAAELIEMPFMLAIMVLAARWIVRRFSLAPRARVRLSTGFIALALVLIAEFGLVGPLRDLPPKEYLASMDPVSGRVYYALLLLYAFLPELMQSRRWYSRHAVAVGVFALLCTLGLLMYAGYVADLGAAHQRIAAGSDLVHTPCGPIEYAQRGTGPAVLLVHGAGGGFDQGLEIAEELARQGLHVVAMSRFGYLRTPLPKDASPQAQADAHACLLDALQIGRAAIIGVSAGAPSTMQFALRHPQRTDAMVLLVPLAYVPREASAAQPSSVVRFMLEQSVKSDFVYWLTLRVAPGLVVKSILATPPQLLAQADAVEQGRVARLMERILPLSSRQAGLINDAGIAESLIRYELERVSVPTLVISAADDLYGTYESAGYTAAHIGGARFIGYASGGHVWVGHHRELMAELRAFVAVPRAALVRR
jgi:pimeloyl-ACP methyl ester carboxylesterase